MNPDRPISTAIGLDNSAMRDNPQASFPTLLTLSEVADQLSISPRTVRRRIAAGLIRKAPIGGRTVRISFLEVLRIMGAEPPARPPEDTSVLNSLDEPDGAIPQ